MKKVRWYFPVFCLVFLLPVPNVWAGHGPSKDSCADKVCKSQIPASIGGPVAKSDNLLTLRWLGAANIELTYKNQVVLLSTYFDVNPREEQVIDPKDVVRADAIFLGHAHGDHMSDTAQVATQTGATVFADPISYNRLLNLDPDGGTFYVTERDGSYKLDENGLPIPSSYNPLPEDQLEIMQDGSFFQFDGFTVEAIHIFHSGIDDPDGPRGPNRDSFPLLDAYGDNAWDGPRTAEEIAKEAAVMAKGSMDPRIRTEGVRAILFTFGKDFRLIYYDSASTVISESIRAAMERIGNKTDVALVAYAGGHSHTQVPYTMVPIKAFNPRLFIPEHHDGHWEMSTERLFQAIRNEMPNTQSLSLLYKEPVCFNVKSHLATKTSPLGDEWRYDMK